MKALVAVLFAAVSTTALAQDPPRDPLKDFKVGDRVELVLGTGFSVQGQIIARDPKISELAKMAVITLDIGYEYPELKGHVGVERIHIKTARKLPILSPDDLAARDKARAEALKRMDAEDQGRRARLAEREIEIEKSRRDAEKKEKTAEKMKGVGAELEAKAEMIKKGAELFAKFPPEAGWGVDKAKAIAQKTVIQVPATEDEKAFMASIDVWMQYKSYLDEQKLKAKEQEAVGEVKKEPEPKKEEAPKP